AHILAFPSFSALTDRLDEINLAWGRVRAFGEESLSQPSVEARGVFVDVRDDLGHQRKTVQSPYRFSHSASGINSDARPPKRGEHNFEALADWLGLEAGDVSALSEAGVLLSE
ncbi:MAG: hypothetical protein ACPIE8_06075, partial [Henriciella sp.]